MVGHQTKTFPTTSCIPWIELFLAIVFVALLVLLALTVHNCILKPLRAARQGLGSSASVQTYSVFVKIPETREPPFGEVPWEFPLRDFLFASEMGNDTEVYTRAGLDKRVDSVVVTLHVYDRRLAVPRIAANLRELGAPRGTVIILNEMGTVRMDVWSTLHDQ